jgi:hypothetical protein
LRRSAEAEEGQDGEHDNDQADEVDDAVHLVETLNDALNGERTTNHGFGCRVNSHGVDHLTPYGEDGIGAAETLGGALSQDRLLRFGLPLGLLIFGVVLRYVAYATTTPTPSPGGSVDAMCVWDCFWYGDIVLHGYQPYPENLNFGGPAGIANWAFFPAYPLLIAGFRALTQLSPPVLGAIVSPLLTFGAVIASWPLLKGDKRAYALFAVLLLAGPFSFYFSILYSESLFLLLTVVGFVLLGQRRYIAAGLVGAALSATRTVGVLFVFAIAIEFLVELRAAKVPWRGIVGATLKRPDAVLGIFLAPLGLFAFMAWLYLTTGDALGFMHIQRGWDRALVNPFMALWGGLTGEGREPGQHDLQALAVVSVIGLLLCVVMFVRREYAAAVFSSLCLVLALANGVESMLRFVVALAPVCIVFCRLLAARQWLFIVSLGPLIALDFELTIGWMQRSGTLM